MMLLKEDLCALVGFLLVRCSGCSLVLSFSSQTLILWYPFIPLGNGACLDSQRDVQGFTGPSAMLFSVWRGRGVLDAV